MIANVCNLRAIGNGGSYWLMLANHLLLLAVGFALGSLVWRWRGAG